MTFQTQPRSPQVRAYLAERKAIVAARKGAASTTKTDEQKEEEPKLVEIRPEVYRVDYKDKLGREHTRVIYGKEALDKAIEAEKAKTPATRGEIAKPLFEKYGYKVETRAGQTIATKGSETVILAGGTGQDVIIRGGSASKVILNPEFINLVNPTERTFVSSGKAAREKEEKISLADIQYEKKLKGIQTKYLEEEYLPVFPTRKETSQAPLQVLRFKEKIQGIPANIADPLNIRTLTMEKEIGTAKQEYADALSFDLKISNKKIKPSELTFEQDIDFGKLNKGVTPSNYFDFFPEIAKYKVREQRYSGETTRFLGVPSEQERVSKEAKIVSGAEENLFKYEMSKAAEIGLTVGGAALFMATAGEALPAMAIGKGLTPLGKKVFSSTAKYLLSKPVQETVLSLYSTSVATRTAGAGVDIYKGDYTTGGDKLISLGAEVTGFAGGVKILKLTKGQPFASAYYKVKEPIFNYKVGKWQRQITDKSWTYQKPQSLESGKIEGGFRSSKLYKDVPLEEQFFADVIQKPIQSQLKAKTYDPLNEALKQQWKQQEFEPIITKIKERVANKQIEFAEYVGESIVSKSAKNLLNIKDLRPFDKSVNTRLTREPSPASINARIVDVDLLSVEIMKSERPVSKKMKPFKTELSSEFDSFGTGREDITITKGKGQATITETKTFQKAQTKIKAGYKTETKQIEITKTVPEFDYYYKPKTTGKLVTVQDLELEYDLFNKQKTGYRQITKTNTVQISDNLFDTFTKFKTKQKSSTGLKFDFFQEQETVPELAFPLFRQDGKGSSKKIIKQVPEEPAIVGIPTLMFGSTAMEKEKPKGFFNTHVKEKGKWIKVNEKPREYYSAMGLGGEVVDNTSSAQFRVSKSKTKGEESLGFGDWFGRESKFRKTKTNSYIEKNTYRIDSYGELQGITVKGWLANRKKNAGWF